ncbi:MAG TPA: YggS family pyridoxal phosphate-dependent enzyme [Rectinemataceae bacterium]
MKESEIEDNIARIKERIARAEARSGRKPGSVSLMAVSKFQPFEAIERAIAAGVELFGENRVQEAMGKIPAGFRESWPGCRVDLIGNLQTNKVGKSLGFFDSIQSVGSIALLQAILSRSSAARHGMGLYLELRTGEESKSGFSSAGELFAAIEKFLSEHEAASRFRLCGIMTMAPFTDSIILQRKAFSRARKALEEARKRYPLLGMDELSMGMSSDFETAIEEGSTMVRIGTAIFGSRLR